MTALNVYLKLRGKVDGPTVIIDIGPTFSPGEFVVLTELYFKVPISLYQSHQVASMVAFDKFFFLPMNVLDKIGTIYGTNMTSRPMPVLPSMESYFLA